MAQGPYPNTGDHSVCLNATEPYGVPLTAGSTYAWSITPLAGGNGTITPGATPNLITVNWTTVGTATMQVIETNSNGCVGDPVTITVNINPLPTVTVNSSSICPGSTATITATLGTAGTYNYVWTVPAAATNPGNVATFTSGVAGTYSVVITNTATGCGSASSSGTVTINAAPTLVITNPPAICGTGTADLTAPAVTAGSSPGLTFSYYTDAAATIVYPTPLAATPGTYYIKGTLAGGCSAIQPVVVTANPLPTVTVNSSTVCAGTLATITATPGTAGTYNYVWTVPAAAINPGNVATFTSGVAGTYSVIITNTATGCASAPASGTVTVNAAPTLVITNPPAVCGTGTVNLQDPAITAGSSPNLTFEYFTDAAATVVYPTPAAATAGTYYIKATNASGCFTIQPVVVTVNPLPTPVVTGPSPVCVSVAGNTSTYSTPNVAGHTYNWTVVGGTIATGQGTNTITVTWTTAGAGTVSVTETITASGCTGSNTLNVTVNPKPVTSPITHN
jgi:hypothetical protein